MTAGHVGRLLISKPDLADPNFDGTVTLVLAHDTTGAFGVVLNRPMPVLVDDAFVGWEDLAGSGAQVFSGGPVETDSVIALGESRDGSGELPMGLVSVDLMEDPVLVAAEGILRVRVFAGYAGWGPGQLEGELTVGAWWLVDAEVSDVFVPDPTGLWPLALKRGGGEMEWFAHYPSDPSAN